MAKISMTVKVEHSIKEEFDKIAKTNALNKSQWVENLMKKYINENKKGEN